MSPLPPSAGERRSKTLASFTSVPEFNLAVFALLLNFPWELAQAPLYRGMVEAPLWQALKTCGLATAGDAVIILVAYWVVAATTHRGWIATPRLKNVMSFVAVGLAVTSGIEWMALHGLWVTKWQYASTMPVISGVGIGLSPLLQWILLPPLVVWFAKRQSAVPRD